MKERQVIFRGCDAIMNKYVGRVNQYCRIKATWQGRWKGGYVAYCGRHKRLRESEDLKWERI